jgi:hypothetical protein
VSYDVVAVLGRGGSAVVELALDDHGRRVATKRVALTGSARQMHVARRRLQREAEILDRLAHPGIVPIIDVVDDGTDLILVFPALVENLEDRVRRLGPLSAAEVVAIGHVLLAALATAHRHGIVHRDIKPANVLFDQVGRPALSDFGTAITREVTAGLTPTEATVGTPMWMAPEQARGEPATPASDVFSLAATLCFAATGHSPYGSGPVATVMARAGRGDIRAIPTGVPGELRTPLRRMLDANPERRPSAAAMLGGLDGTTVTPVPPAGRPKRRRRRVVVALLAVVVAVVLAGVLAGAGLVLSGLGGRAAPAPPHTIGKNCAPGWYHLDATSGCQFRSDYVAGTILVAGVPVRANLVPMAAQDSFTTHVRGDALALCWGSLHVTLTAPARTAEQLTVWKGATRLADAISTDGAPATATIDKPSCFGGDSEDLQVTVTALAATGAASASDFTLTRDGGW